MLTADSDIPLQSLLRCSLQWTETFLWRRNFITRSAYKTNILCMCVCPQFIFWMLTEFHEPSYEFRTIWAHAGSLLHNFVQSIYGNMADGRKFEAAVTLVIFSYGLQAIYGCRSRKNVFMLRVMVVECEIAAWRSWEYFLRPCVWWRHLMHHRSKAHGIRYGCGS